MGTGSSSGLVPAADKILKKNNLKLSDFDLMAVNHGPGAFTSLRVIVVTVNSINFAMGLRVMPVCGLEALMTKVKAKSDLAGQFDYVACLLKAYSGQAFVKIFKADGTPVNDFESACLSFDELEGQVFDRLKGKKVLVAGNGASGLSGLKLPEGVVVDPAFEGLEPDAQSVAQLACQKFMDGQEPVSKVIPNYLKAGFV